MNASSPLVFRPSLAQRTVSALLCAGSWIIGGRTLALLLHSLPRMHASLKMAQAASEPTTLLWIGLVASILACVTGGILLLLSLLALLLIEGSQVLVDELGIAVDHGALPGPLARWLGAGRLGWKEVATIEKGRPFFVLKGGNFDDKAGTPRSPVHPAPLKFLMVDELERLILIILERSPNLRLDE